MQFPASGSYTLRAATTNFLGSAATHLIVLVNPPGTLTFRAGENGYAQDATFIRADTPTWNSGARDQILVGRNNGGMRALLAFDLSGAPTGAVLQSATLDLCVAAAGNGTMLTNLGLHELLQPFTEGTGDGSSSTNGAGTGADWNNRDVAVAWTAPGGLAGTDYAAMPLVSIPGFDPSITPVGTRITFPSNPEMVAAVSNALRLGQRFDMMIKMTNDTLAGSLFARLASDDHGTVSNRPGFTLVFNHIFAPTVDAGAPPAPFVGVSTALNGAVSNAPTSVWSQVSGPGVAWFANAALPATTVTFDQPGNYVLRLSASNTVAECAADLAIAVAVLLPPQLGGPSHSNGQFQFEVSGTPGVSTTIEGSSNLVTWESLFTTNPAAMPFLWADTNGSPLPQRFYRVKVGPNP